MKKRLRMGVLVLGIEERKHREQIELKTRRELEILQAAEKLFLDKGFQQTTMSDISEACELTRGAIYLYYKNKGELVLIVMAGISGAFADLLDQAVAGGGTGAERLKNALNVYNRTYRDYRSYHVLDAQFNAVFFDRYPDSPRLEEYFQANRRVLEIISTVIEDGINDGSLRAPSFLLPERAEKSAGIIARMLLNALNSYVEKISIRKQLMEKEQGVAMEKELGDYINFIAAGLLA